MATYIRVDDHGLRRKLENLSSKELIAAERRGITEAVKLGRSVARAGAPKKSGKGAKGISYKTRTRAGVVEGRVFNKVFYMRFQARGTGERHTRKGASRGVLPALPFMSNAARRVDPVVPKLVEREIAKALFKARLK